MSRLQQMFAKNKFWAEEMNLRSPGFFEKLSHLQTPDYLWIGCADSRVPANEIVGLFEVDPNLWTNYSGVSVKTGSLDKSD